MKHYPKCPKCGYVEEWGDDGKLYNFYSVGTMEVGAWAPLTIGLGSREPECDCSEAELGDISGTYDHWNYVCQSCSKEFSAFEWEPADDEARKAADREILERNGQTRLELPE
jgi:DNA-directed RNA polymerase subunit RPC12/RpoP